MSQLLKGSSLESAYLSKVDAEANNSGESEDDEEKPQTKKYRAKTPEQIRTAFPLIKIRKKIYVNLTCCKYDVHRDVLKAMNWKETEDEDDWNLFWTDTSVGTDRLKRLRSFQKINHFPGMSEITRKDNLARNMNKLKNQFPEDYKFVPTTWILPHDYNALAQYFNSARKSKTIIVKPDASCQGRGIFLTRHIEDLNSTDDCVVQQYISKPHLINGLKYDLRLYVLVASCNPLRMFMHRKGIIRFATVEYTKPTDENLENTFMHLTNYAVNKRNTSYIQAQSNSKSGDSKDDGSEPSGSKWSHQDYRKYLREKEGVDDEAVWHKICAVCVKTVTAISGILRHTYRLCTPQDKVSQRVSMCFEVLGFDVMLDHKLEPHLIEVNHSPSFTCDTPLDYDVKFNVVKDTMTIMNINSKDRTESLKEEKQKMMSRLYRTSYNRQPLPSQQKGMAPSSKAKQQLPSPSDRKTPPTDSTPDFTNFDKWTSENLGGFYQIYPIPEFLDFQRFVLSPEHFFAAETVSSKTRKELVLKTQAEKERERGRIRALMFKRDNRVKENKEKVGEKNAVYTLNRDKPNTDQLVRTNQVLTISDTPTPPTIAQPASSQSHPQPLSRPSSTQKLKSISPTQSTPLPALHHSPRRMHPPPPTQPLCLKPSHISGPLQIDSSLMSLNPLDPSPTTSLTHTQSNPSLASTSLSSSLPTTTLKGADTERFTSSHTLPPTLWNQTSFVFVGSLPLPVTSSFGSGRDEQKNGEEPADVITNHSQPLLDMSECVSPSFIEQRQAVLQKRSALLRISSLMADFERMKRDQHSHPAASYDSKKIAQVPQTQLLTFPDPSMDQWRGDRDGEGGHHERTKVEVDAASSRAMKRIAPAFTTTQLARDPSPPTRKAQNTQPPQMQALSILSSHSKNTATARFHLPLSVSPTPTVDDLAKPHAAPLGPMESLSITGIGLMSERERLRGEREKASLERRMLDLRREEAAVAAGTKKVGGSRTTHTVKFEEAFSRPIQAESPSMVLDTPLSIHNTPPPPLTDDAVGGGRKERDAQKGSGGSVSRVGRAVGTETRNSVHHVNRTRLVGQQAPLVPPDRPNSSLTPSLATAGPVPQWLMQNRSEMHVAPKMMKRPNANQFSKPIRIRAESRLEASQQSLSPPATQTNLIKVFLSQICGECKPLRAVIANCLLLWTSTPRSYSAFLAHHRPKVLAFLDHFASHEPSIPHGMILAHLCFSPQLDLSTRALKVLYKPRDSNSIVPSFLQTHEMPSGSTEQSSELVPFASRLCSTLTTHVSQLKSLLTKSPLHIGNAVLEMICEGLSLIYSLALHSEDSIETDLNKSGMIYHLKSTIVTCLDLIEQTKNGSNSSPSDQTDMLYRVLDRSWNCAIVWIWDTETILPRIFERAFFNVTDLCSLLERTCHHSAQAPHSRHFKLLSKYVFYFVDCVPRLLEENLVERMLDKSQPMKVPTAHRKYHYNLIDSLLEFFKKPRLSLFEGYKWKQIRKLQFERVLKPGPPKSHQTFHLNLIRGP
ncbi:putative Tubulin glycylase 3C [Blattamonas nauphoetae]|uniref:Tubulin glycylase 3C n=1 Tax=Blattamonas nauphoetae TaxID=2049346 RepID=A0ABQ9XA46_9EUKA|nr:putative Tubulin glycylase 3C [Blattamonas nauphoetae]